jgi:hypothetical protein
MTDNEVPRSIGRRHLLATAGTGGLGLLAGCSGSLDNSESQSSGGDRTDTDAATAANADLSVSLDGPSEVEFGGEFTLTVKAKNKGGKTGEFSGILRSATEISSFEQEVQLSVPAGETKSVETEPILPEGITSYSFELYEISTSTATVESRTVEHDEESETPLLTTTVDVVPAEIGIGESVVVSEALETTFTGIEFAHHVWLEATYYGGDVEPAAAPEGSVFAIYSVEVTNTSESSHYSWDLADDLIVENGEIYEHDRQVLVELTGGDMESTWGGSYNEGVRIDRGETVSGYVLATVSREAAAESAPLLLQLDAETAEPEYRFPFASETPRSFPRFELTNIDVPETVPRVSPTSSHSQSPILAMPLVLPDRCWN